VYLEWFEPIEINNWRGYCIGQLLFTHGTQVAPSVYKTKKGGEEVQTDVPLLATVFNNIKLLALAEAYWVNNS
jgi:hypothetical protein